jgi:hypothetical protein
MVQDDVVDDAVVHHDEQGRAARLAELGCHNIFQYWL